MRIELKSSSPITRTFTCIVLLNREHLSYYTCKHCGQYHEVICTFSIYSREARPEVALRSDLIAGKETLCESCDDKKKNNIAQVDLRAITRARLENVREFLKVEKFYIDNHIKRDDQ